MRKVPPSAAAIAQALVQQHGFVYDVAWLSAWYSLHSEPPKIGPLRALSAMSRVKVVPRLSKEEADRLLECYARRGEGEGA